MEKSIDLEKISRIEVINHANNRYPIGRVVTLYKELDEFDSVEISIQDDGRTMKIFVSSNKEKSSDK
jgi:hypothetical protein